MSKNKFQSGWDEEFVRHALAHYESQTEEQLELGSSNRFWKLIEERRAQKTISREELERESSGKSKSAREQGVKS